MNLHEEIHCYHSNKKLLYSGSAETIRRFICPLKVLSVLIGTIDTAPIIWHVYFHLYVISCMYVFNILLWTRISFKSNNNCHENMRTWFELISSHIVVMKTTKLQRFSMFANSNFDFDSRSTINKLGAAIIGCETLADVQFYTHPCLVRNTMSSDRSVYE